MILFYRSKKKQIEANTFKMLEQSTSLSTLENAILNSETLIDSTIWATIMGSFNVEGFGSKKVLSIKDTEINKRYTFYKNNL